MQNEKGKEKKEEEYENWIKNDFNRKRRFEKDRRHIVQVICMETAMTV